MIAARVEGRGEEMRRRVGLVAIMLMVILGASWPGAAHAAGLTYIKEVSGSSPHRVWRFGPQPSITSAPRVLPAEIIDVQVPGCQEGPCPDDMVVVFPGAVVTEKDAAYVDEVAQVDESHYLVMAGFCEYSCILRVFSVNLAQQATAIQFKKDLRPLKEAACGYTFIYHGQTYTVRTIPDAKSIARMSPHLSWGARTCRS